MTSLKMLKPALRSPWLPLALLLIALSTVFIFAGDRGYFYRPGVDHNWLSSHHLSIAVNLSPEHGFQRFERRTIDDEGVTGYRWPFNRFPPGGYISMKLAAMPFGGSPSAQLYAVRILMLLLFAGAAVLAYLSLCRLTSNRWVALTATLLSFSSYYLLYYADMTANEGMLDFFGVMLTFHGMVVFVQEGRFRQLLVKTCIALLLGWHVLALVAPFVIFGLARDFLQTRSAAAASPPPDVMSSRLAASALLRRRYLLLGAVALAFGLAILTFNFAMEYAAFDGEMPLTELPSFQSMLTHTGIDQGIIQALWTWGRFLDEQFSRISHMFIPYALLGGSDAVEGPTRISEFQGVVLGIFLSTACLIGSIFVRPRILFATLASFGFFWALPMYRTTEFNDFESIYYIGLPLVFFTLALLWVRMLTKRDGVIAAASVIALLLFTVSSFQMSRVGYSAERAQAARGAEQDLSVIRELTAGELVTILRIGGIYKEFIAWRGYAEHAIHYYLNSHPIRYEYLPAVEGGFVIMRERIDTPALLTPQNQHFFLYDRDSLEAWYEATYRTAASTDPLALEDFDVYFDDRIVYYLKEPCERADMSARFFLDVYPIDENDLPEDRRQRGYDDLNFVAFERGLLFDGKCLARFVLPQYSISNIKTGRVGEAWNAVHYLNPPELISETQSIASNEPAARAKFDIYIDGGKLYYFRESCVRADTAARFFLHVYPIDENDLPDDRREQEYDNLDFDFDEHGALFDDKCAAAVPLPQYAITQITTGQFDSAERIWNAVHYLNPPELILETQSIASNEPAVSSEFDMYIDGGKLYYVKEPCVLEDTAASFFLHVYPVDENDLPEVRRQVGYDNLDFSFGASGVLFDDKCAAAVPLPQYPIARIDTGQFDSDERIWSAVHHFHPPKLILETQSIASNEPAARSKFDIYIDGGKLYYFREPCIRADTATRFFLHVYPVEENDLPEIRRQVGYDNLDFDFDTRGVLFDDKCAAAVPLPQYVIARIDTGQFDSDERIWEVGFPPIPSNEPAARSKFDIYLDGGKLYYSREPCVRADTATRFFLHVYPIDENDLSEDHRQRGYDNLDFDFGTRGVMSDDKCTAAVPLPQYPIAQITTGQFDSAERIWEVGFPPILSNEPAARAKFDIYIDGGKLYYFREPCLRADTATRFFLHVYPIDENDLPEDRRQRGYDNLDFDFGTQGVLFDDECVAAVPLPQYDIAQITTGQFDGNELIWNAVHLLNPPKLISETQSILSNEPAARSKFDIYIDGGKLYYYREPCVLTDTATRFFLHVYPVDENDLPEDRWQREYDNLDFDFGAHGVMFDDECAAAVPLPQYPIARIDTGQFDSAERIWEVGFPPILSNEPAARSKFDIYIDGGKLYYFREPCVRADTVARFFLHVYPIDENDLSEDRWQRGYDNLDFDFGTRGVLFDDECVAAVPLPQYDIAQITTGQFDGNELIWNAVHLLNPPKLISETQSILSNEPAARSKFDIYLDGGKLYYFREPCVRADTAARFFLHVYPIDENDLPEDRWQREYDNLDFDFGERGVLFDDECAAVVPLPQYPIARIDTGQFDSAERIWEVGFPPSRE